MVRRPLNRSILPDTSSLAPTGICRCRLNLKKTSSALPVASFTTTRQGWRSFAGGSMRTTSTDSVTTGRDGRRNGRSLATGRHTTRAGETAGRSAVAAGSLGDQRADRRSDAFQRGQRREQRGEGIMIHGLTCGYRARYMTLRP